MDPITFAAGVVAGWVAVVVVGDLAAAWDFCRKNLCGNYPDSD